MPYNYYYPQYQGMPFNASQLPYNGQTQSNGITWVQGEAAAKAFPVGSGQSVLLMDSEDSVMYIKSTDQSGMPQPLRIFDYTERGNKAIPDEVDYISRKEFEEFKKSLERGEG